MNCGQPWTTGKSHNKKSLTCKSGERSVGGSQSAQSSSKDEESVKLTDFFKKKKKRNQWTSTKKQQTTEFSPKEIQNKVLLFMFQKHNIFDWAILHCHTDVSVNV